MHWISSDHELSFDAGSLIRKRGRGREEIKGGTYKADITFSTLHGRWIK